MQLYTHNGTVGRGRTTCPPHGPHLVRVFRENTCVVQCLACGLEGPEGKNSMEAKQAFDEASIPGQLPELIHRSA
jgi:hypothetical protein